MAVSTRDLAGDAASDARLPGPGEAEAALRDWLARFDSALQRGDLAAAAGEFLPDAYLRDLLACSWSVRSFHGPANIQRALDRAVTQTHPRAFALDLAAKAKVVARERWGRSAEGFIRFETDTAHGRGHLRLRRDAAGQWRAWTLLTAVDELIGHEEQVGSRRPKGVAFDGVGGSTWLERRTAALAYDHRSPEVLILGAGHSGLTLSARLTALGVDALMVERNERVGDNWRSRYRSLYLHNEVWANHLPYVPYPPTWPVYTSKDKLADWLESYATTLDLNVWTSTVMRGARYSPDEGAWTVQLVRGDDSVRILRPRHIVLAMGVFGEPRGLSFVGEEQFTGTILTSQRYQSDSQAHGRKVLVIGTGSSAHDIAQDYCLGGADVTMLQRSSTCVISVEPGAAQAYAPYHEGGDPVEDCDLVGAATPIPLLAEFHKDLTRQVAAMDADLLDGLERAGFRTDFGADGSGFLMKYYRQGGGYYINVGCSELIIDGKIKVKQGTVVDHLREREVVFADGSTLPVDVIVVATGFANMQDSIRSVLGAEVAERVGPVWGLDEEGEVRAMWRPLGQPGLWIMGGSFVQCRLMSKVLALQIKARQVGIAGASSPTSAGRAE